MSPTANHENYPDKKNVVVTLMSMWSTAQAWQYVQHNPFPRGASGRLLLALPAAAPGPTYDFTVEEALAIIGKAAGRWKTFFRTMGETGLRPGEMAGLKRDGVLRGQQSLKITQSVWGQQVQTPKSSAGVRTLAISKQLAEDLCDLIGATPDNEHGLVWMTDKGRGKRNPGGKPLSMDNFRQRVLNPILKELGIDKKLKRLGIARCGNYPFRHMNATLMDGLNTPMKTRQKRLGHAQIETTLKHYTHAIDADDRMAADRIGALLSANGNQAAESPEDGAPGILAHPGVQAEIARQVALVLRRQSASIIEASQIGTLENDAIRCTNRDGRKRE